MIGVIPAAGFGKRMYPLSADIPKPMLPVLNKPIIEYVIDCMKKESIEEILVIVGYKKEEFKLKGVKLVEQKVIDGTVSAIKLVEKYIDGDFVVMWGDNFFKGNLKDLIASHKEKKTDITIMLDRENTSQAKVYMKDGKICSAEERPKKVGGYSPAGVYAFSSTIFDYIDEVEKSETGEYEMSDLLKLALNKGKINYVWLKGWRMNLTTPADLLKVNLKALDELGKSYHVGKNCTINGEVKRCVIGNQVEITQSKITNSLILDGAKISNSILDNIIVRVDKIIEGVNKAGVSVTLI
jgi:glucose-1-phosphate thymidylyltransferase